MIVQGPLVARIFGQGEGTSEASTCLACRRRKMLGFLVRVKPLDAIWHWSSVFSYAIRVALIWKFRRQLLQVVEMELCIKFQHCIGEYS